MELVSADTGSRLSRALPSARLWAVFLAGTSVHLLLRAQADDLGRRAHSLAGPEQAIFHGFPNLWLQHWLGTDNAILNVTAILLHSSWFFVPFALAILVQVRCGRPAFARLVALHLTLLFFADAVYTLWPTKPPWMTIDLIRVAGHASATRLDDNPIASFPSLHVAVPVLYALFVSRQHERVLRRIAPFVSLWALGITWAVVYGGEHYLVGCLGSAFLSCAVYVVGSWSLRALPRRWGVINPVRAVNPRFSTAVKQPVRIRDQG